MRSQPGALIITERALHIAKRRAQLSSFRETGGLLLGFRVTRDVHVVDVLEIRDPAATRTRFTLLANRREDVLNKYLAELPRDSPIGYVGTWHSHLADAGPSWLDRQTFRREIWTARDLVIQMVLARSATGWRPYTLIGRGRMGIATPRFVID